MEESKLNKQNWLENILKKFYRKVSSLEKPRENHQKKLNVPVVYINTFKNLKKERSLKREKSNGYQIVTRSRRQNDLQKASNKKLSKKKHSRRYEKKFWKFVDLFLQSRSFLPRSKNALYIPVIPSPANNALMKNIGNTLNLRSRVVRRQIFNKSDLLGDCGVEGFLSAEINSADDQKALVQKLLLIVQKARRKIATDTIVKEVLAAKKAKGKVKRK